MRHDSAKGLQGFFAYKHLLLDLPDMTNSVYQRIDRVRHAFAQSHMNLFTSWIASISFNDWARGYKVKLPVFPAGHLNPSTSRTLYDPVILGLPTYPLFLGQVKLYKVSQSSPFVVLQKHILSNFNISTCQPLTRHMSQATSLSFQHSSLASISVVQYPLESNWLINWGINSLVVTLFIEDNNA